MAQGSLDIVVVNVETGLYAVWHIIPSPSTDKARRGWGLGLSARLPLAISPASEHLRNPIKREGCV